MNKDCTPLTFGKYKGKTPEEVSKIDPSYVVWMHANVKPVPCSEKLASLCESNDCDYEGDCIQAMHYEVDGWGH